MHGDDIAQIRALEEQADASYLDEVEKAPAGPSDARQQSFHRARALAAVVFADLATTPDGVAEAAYEALMAHRNLEVGLRTLVDALDLDSASP